MNTNRRPRGGRSWRQWLIGSVVGLLVLALVAVVGIGWYFSSQALQVTSSGQAELDVRADREGQVVLSREGYADFLGEHGIRAPVAATGVEDATVVGFVGDIVHETETEVVRTWRPVSGSLPEEPVRALIDQDVFWPDPTAVDVPFEEVQVPGELGDLPAWLVPGAGEAASTWVVHVHGRGATREESLRYLPTLHEAGVTVLVPTYRNDPGAPADPSGQYRLGETEWRDVEAALAYARAEGADRVLVLAWSIGAAISLQTLDRSAEADLVEAVWLDSPVLDWRDTFQAQGALNGLPSPLTSVAILMIERRAGIDLDDYDWVTRADELPDLPIHIEHPDGDSYVPNGPAVALAEARPDVVTLVRDSPAEHTRAWNLDPFGYEERLAAFVKEHGQGG